ncbi:DUF2142 domain-containing protein [Acidiferrimicrobium sp. IK]|uniref:DUF2142 domain-containing protein n=1 Tax=Acidiferrimicrobium sp. IK TaxID=2871700 RepID=UPI0021CB5733|nr:DUF2142 domain-containing protein [Acidiferrimicrobium sp. IK]MCU4187209.1 DUF2142 domain-containing protein [Acidiferrimicrobium sp. IK]
MPRTRPAAPATVTATAAYRDRWRGRRVWLAAFVGFVALGGAWLLATPLGAPPDEPSHINRAYALVHGDVIGSPPGAGQPAAVTAVEVPAGLDALQAVAQCANADVRRPATCDNRVVGSSRLVPHLIYTGRYPPLYYALVGLPTLVASTPGVVYWMRLVSVALSAAFFASALVVACRRSRSVAGPLAVALAVTPTALYLAAAVNPSGLEISSAAALWVALTVLARDRPPDPGGEVTLAGISAVVLVLARGDSPLWPVLMIVCLLPLVAGGDLRGLLARRDVRAWAVRIAAAYAAAVGWVLGEDALAALPVGPRTHTTALHLLRQVVDEMPRWGREYVGVFGAVNAPSPRGVIAGFGVLAAALVLAALARGDNRARLSVAATVAAAAVVPVVLEVIQSRRIGLGAQGRYFLPLVVAVVLVPGLLMPAPAGPARRRRWARRGGWLLVGAAGAGQVAAFAGALRRYSVGVAGPHNPFVTVAAGWRPPLPAGALDLLYAAGVAGVGGCLAAAWRRRSAPPGETRPTRAVGQLDPEYKADLT